MKFSLEQHRYNQQYQQSGKQTEWKSSTANIYYSLLKNERTNVNKNLRNTDICQAIIIIG